MIQTSDVKAVMKGLIVALTKQIKTETNEGRRVIFSDVINFFQLVHDHPEEFIAQHIVDEPDNQSSHLLD